MAALDRQTTERNMRYLVIELVWAAVAIGCYSFAAAFVIRLGGTNLQVSLISSAAALVNALTTIPFAIFLERRARRWPWVVGSLWLLRAGHIGLIVIPFLPAYQAEAVVILLLLVNVPVALFNAGWLPMFADVVPIARRARLLSARSIALGITTMITTIIMGRWLDAVAFPLNYQIMFGFAVVASFLSTVAVAKLVIPDSQVVAVPAVTHFNWRQVQPLLSQQRPFVNITINTLIFNVAFWMAAPLQPIYFVRELQASDGWLGIWLAIISGSAIIGNLIWPRLIERRGYAWVLQRATILSAAYYLLIGLFPDLTLILFFALLFGAITPGVEISHFGTLLEVCDPTRRAFYMGIFVTIMNFGFFASALVAAPLVDLIGARELVLILAGLRLLGALLFTINPVRVQSLEPVTNSR
jgi:MFS family permease